MDKYEAVRAMREESKTVVSIGTGWHYLWTDDDRIAGYGHGGESLENKKTVDNFLKLKGTYGEIVKPPVIDLPIERLGIDTFPEFFGVRVVDKKGKIMHTSLHRSIGTIHMHEGTEYVGDYMNISQGIVYFKRLDLHRSFNKINERNK